MLAHSYRIAMIQGLAFSGGVNNSFYYYISNDTNGTEPAYNKQPTQTKI